MVSVKHFDPCYPTSNDSKLSYYALEKELRKLVHVSIITMIMNANNKQKGLFVALSRPSKRTARSTKVDGIVYENLCHKTVDLGRWITYTGSR